MATDLQSDDLGEFAAFDFPHLESSPAKHHFCRVGPCCQILITWVGVAIFSSAWFWSPPDWLQPTVVGMLWASLFLAGAAAGSVRRGSALFACLAGCHVWLSRLAMQKLTSLIAAECGLIVVCAFCAGWLVTQFEFSGRSISVTQVRRYQQWTLWDLAILTTLVAVICYAMPRLESQLILLCQVGFVLFGGCVCSWVAYRWVFDDCWTLPKLIMMLVGSCVCTWILFYWLLRQQTLNELSLQHTATWMLTGPLAVVAAQGLTVLALLTAIRVDQGSLNPSKRHVEPVPTTAPVEGLRICSS